MINQESINHNKEILENPELRDNIKEQLKQADLILSAAMALNMTDEYIRLVNPEYKGRWSKGDDLGIRVKTGWHGVWKITIGGKVLIFTSRKGAPIHSTLKHHLERYNRCHLGQLSRNELAIGTYFAENRILTIKDFVDHGGTIELLEQNPDLETNKRREKEIISKLMLEHGVSGVNDKIWNQRQG